MEISFKISYRYENFHEKNIKLVQIIDIKIMSAWKIIENITKKFYSGKFPTII